MEIKPIPHVQIPAAMGLLQERDGGFAELCGSPSPQPASCSCPPGDACPAACLCHHHRQRMRDPRQISPSDGEGEWKDRDDEPRAAPQTLLSEKEFQQQEDPPALWLSAVAFHSSAIQPLAVWVDV